MSSAQKRSSQGDGTGTDLASEKGTQLPKRTKLGPSAAGDEAVSLQRLLDEALDFINSQGLASSTTKTSHTTWLVPD